MKYKELIQLIKLGESETLEFKQSFSKAVIETIVAFSNTRGGKILVGVNNQQKIVGVSATEETVQKWINEIKQNTEPSIFPRFDIYEFDLKKIIVVTVDEFPLKPVAYKDRYFARKKNSNHKLSVNEIVEMRFISLNYSFDSFEVNSDFINLNQDALAFFGKRIAEEGRYKPGKDLIADLKKLHIVKESGTLTRAAELLLGSNNTSIHLGRFKSQTAIIDDVIIRNPLILAVDEALDFIKRNIALGFEFGGDGLKRKDRWQYPIPAIRELLLNAVVHKDF